MGAGHPTNLKQARKQKSLTEKEVAAKLGVSQSYVALFENGKRRFRAELARKAAKFYGPTVLPVQNEALHLFNPAEFANELAALGYPGFSYLKSKKKRNPVELLLKALAQPDLEARLTEALPWLLTQYPSFDKDWLVREARLRNLQNRLGFVVHLANDVLERSGRSGGREINALSELKSELKDSRLAREDTLCQSSLSPSERDWLRSNRTPAAEYWNLLTDWRTEHLSYAR
jgi:transcriptional regulator with XRE-family HTH domain